MAERWGARLRVRARRWFSPLRIVFVVMVAFVASLVGNAFAHYMVHATVDNGTFEDGYMYRHLFEIGAVAFILAAMLARRAFRAACAAIGRERRGRQPR